MKALHDRFSGLDDANGFPVASGATLMTASTKFESTVLLLASPLGITETRAIPFGALPVPNKARRQAGQRDFFGVKALADIVQRNFEGDGSARLRPSSAPPG